ncbi:MAG: hypothetical protein WCE94_03655 [Candidatus Methanoperedens sp.]
MIPLEVEFTKRIVTSVIRYFKNQGFQADYEIVDGSKIETKEGIDAIAIIGDKILGIQTKRPNESNSYALEERQYGKIQQRVWAYYAFPEKVSRKEWENVLHRTIFSKGNFQYKSNVSFEDIKDGVRWGDIAKGIEECPIGLKIKQKEDYQRIDIQLKELIEDYFVIFSINMEKQQVKLSSGTDIIIDKRVFRTKKDNQLDNPSVPERIADRTKKCPRCGWPD